MGFFVEQAPKLREEALAADQKTKVYWECEVSSNELVYGPAWMPHIVETLQDSVTQSEQVLSAVEFEHFLEDVLQKSDKYCSLNSCSSANCRKGIIGAFVTCVGAVAAANACKEEPSSGFCSGAESAG